MSTLESRRRTRRAGRRAEGAEPESFRVPLVELQEFMCRWISDGTGMNARHCGHRILPRRSWCAYHAGLVFRPPTEEEQAKFKAYRLRRDG